MSTAPPGHGDDSATALWLAADVAALSTAEQLALDEALLSEVHEGTRQRLTVRTWMASSPAVIVGSSSRVEDEVDRAVCERLGVPILRRPSGGATVVLGPGCVMWSVVMPCPTPPPAIESLHAELLGPLARSLSGFGSIVCRQGTSDLAVEDCGVFRKVSGNALRVRRQAVLYHGTLLDHFDLELVSRLLRHPPREPSYRGRRSHGDFLANLGLGRQAVDQAVRQAFGARSMETSWPRSRVLQIAAERYLEPAWTYRMRTDEQPGDCRPDGNPGRM